MTRLTFQNGKFVFVSPTQIKSAAWVLSGYGDEPYTYETTSLKAAVQFRRYADAKAERIFKRALAQMYDVQLLPPLSFLDPHQRKGIEWVLTRSRSYLAHAPGAGKTCQAIVAASLIPLPGPILIIVPPTLTQNWQREIQHFTTLMGIYPSIAVVPLSAKQHSMEWSADFVICPDSLLAKRWVYTNLLKLKAKFIAVDEASRFKEITAQRSKAFYGGKHDTISYPGLFQDARHTVFLDGSPMPNRPMELWAPAFYLDPASIDYMDNINFGYRYCGPTLGAFGIEFKGSSHESELKEKLQKSFMHVVTENELSHPERLRSILVMSTDPRSPKTKTWELKNLSKIDLSTLKEGDKGELAKWRKEVGLSKVNWCSQYIRQRLDDKKESILVFAWHREVCEKLAQQLQWYDPKFKPFIVYGGVKSSEREKAFKEFNEGKRKLIIGNIQAMGRGHNLQTASRVVFVEPSWTDELNKQCEKRASRRGSTKLHVRCEYIVVPDSLDEIILKSVFTKEKRVKKVIG